MGGLGKDINFSCTILASIKIRLSRGLHVVTILNNIRPEMRNSLNEHPHILFKANNILEWFELIHHIVNRATL